MGASWSFGILKIRQHRVLEVTEKHNTLAASLRGRLRQTDRSASALVLPFDTELRLPSNSTVRSFHMRLKVNPSQIDKVETAVSGSN